MLKSIKNFTWKIDKLCFNGKVKKFYIDYIVRTYHRSYRKDQFSYGYSSQYKKNINSQINQLCQNYGTDKGGGIASSRPPFDSHNYSDIYELLFRMHKEDVKLVIECGIGTNNPKLESSMGVYGKPGASLGMWKEYFPNAKIIGLDIDKQILFSEDRIETYYCDQSNNESIRSFVEKSSLNKSSVDIIIDDGLHTFAAGKAFFEGIIEYLADNGIYILEDVNANDLFSYKDYFLKISDKYTAHFIDLSKPRVKINDNRIIVIYKNK